MHQVRHGHAGHAGHAELHAADDGPDVLRAADADDLRGGRLRYENHACALSWNHVHSPGSGHAVCSDVIGIPE